MKPSVTPVREVAGRVGPGESRELARRLARAARRVGVDRGALDTLAVRIVDDRTMQRLHARFLGDDRTTDVLSFPMVELPEAGAEAAGLGDIVLNWDAVERQARATDRAALLDEATLLCVHGLAHLMGHDHAERGEGRAMHRLERRALRAVGVPDAPRPYGLR